MNVSVLEKNEIEQKTDKFDRFCFWAILFDIFFLPYFSVISTSYSIPLIVLWFVLRGKRTHEVKEYKYFSIVVVLMLTAVMMCHLYYGEMLYETTLTTSIKRFAQYLTSFWYFFFFADYIKRDKTNLSNIVFWAIMYIAVLALLYFLFRDDYATIKASLHPADNHTRRWLSGVLYEYRYNFLWADPNNVAYAVTAMVLFYFSEDKQGKMFRKLILLVSLAFILFCTMSVGGITIAVLSFAFFIIANALSDFSIRTKMLNRLPIILIVIVLVLTVFGNRINDFFSSDIIEGLIRRRSFYENASDMTGGRVSDLTSAVRLLKPQFLIVGSGKEGFTTENGHIYLIAMYGLPVYLYFMYVLFGRKQMKIRKYVIFLPTFIGFTMNIAIIEQKYLLIILLFAAYFSGARTYEGNGGT